MAEPDFSITVDTRAALRGECVEIEDGSGHPQARGVLAAIAISDPVRRRFAGTRGARRLIAALRVTP